MNLNIYKSVSNLCPILLKPIIKFLLKIGVNYKQFSKIAREVYVECASEKHNSYDNKTNIARVVIETGISRKEVKRIHLNNISTTKSTNSILVNNFACSVMNAWHSDSEYLDNNKKPLKMSIDGKKPNFETLIEAHGCDIPVKTALRELVENGLIKVNPADNTVMPLQRFVKHSKFEETRIRSLIEDHIDFGKTVYQNLTSKHKKDSRFQVKAYSQKVTSKLIPEFRAMLRKKGYEFAFEIDEWLQKNEIKDNNEANHEIIKLGLGMYLIEDNNLKSNFIK